MKVAPRLLDNLSYTTVTADKGYLSRDLKAELAQNAVDLVTPRRKNQLPPPKREQTLYKGRRIIETTFSSRDRLGLSVRPYRLPVASLSTFTTPYSPTSSTAHKPLGFGFAFPELRSIFLYRHK